MRWLLTLAILTLATSACPGQTIVRAECRPDGIVQLAYQDGTIRQQPKEPLQVGCDSVTLADDKHTVGWSVLVANCCTSYPVPTSVVVLVGSRKRTFSPGQMIDRWRFLSGARRLAILSGPVHGNAAKATLYDVHSGRRVATWTGTGPPPSWAAEWKPDFGLD